MNKPRTVIIAPHPDDEWIGCGCSILKKIDNKENVLVLIITKMLFSENRIMVSKELAKQYGYKLKILGVPEKQINKVRLAAFLRKNIRKNDIIYLPSNDLHPDHRKIRLIALRNIENNIIYEYAVYNNSLNPVIRLRNKILYLITGRARSSFRKNRAEKSVIYKITEKNKNIRKFLETPRERDLLRVIKNKSKV